MGKVFDAMMRAERERDEHSLRDRLRDWIPRRRVGEMLETLPVREPVFELRTSPPEDASLAHAEKLASLQVAVDALDGRISAEVVEREAKLLEEIRRGMHGLEIVFSDRFAAASLEMKRSVQRSKVVVGFGALLFGLVVGVLSQL